MKLVELYKHEKLCQTIAFNENAKVIYLRPPRTASTSMLRGFLELKVPGFHDFKRNPNIYNKWSKSLTENSLNKYLVITSVRNPYDRTISILGNRKFPKLRINNLHDFLYSYNNLFINEHKHRMHIEPFSVLNFFKSEKQFDFEIRFETLQEDHKELCKLLQIKHSDLPILMSSNRDNYKKYYDAKLIKMVNKIYYNDFKFHNYKMVKRFD